MTFWQGLIISLLAESTDILSSGGEALTNSEVDDQEKYAKQAQNFLICLEMLGFSIAHFYCFPVEEWEDGYRPTEDRSKFGDNMALGDFLHDLKLIMRHKSKKKKSKEQMGSRSNSVGSFTTVPEEDEEVGSLLDNVEELLLEESSSPSSSKERKGRSIMHESDGDDPFSPNTRQKGNALKTKSLGKEADDQSHVNDLPYELRQARALLLESCLLDDTTASLLTSDMLHHLSNERQMNDEADQGLKESIAIAEEEVEIDYDEAQSSAGAAPGSVPNEEEDHVATEFLVPTSPNDHVLRPSIFTMHSKSLEEIEKSLGN